MVNNKMTDSGTRETFESGAVRDSAADKPRPDLISPFALERIGTWLALGAKKYTPRNWEAGIPISRCIASLFRHLMQYMQGDRSEDHLAAIATNACFCLHFEEVIKRGVLPPSLLDMPLYRPKSEVNITEPQRRCRSCRFCDNDSDEVPCNKCDSGYSEWQPPQENEDEEEDDDAPCCDCRYWGYKVDESPCLECNKNNNCFVPLSPTIDDAITAMKAGEKMRPVITYRFEYLPGENLFVTESGNKISEDELRKNYDVTWEFIEPTRTTPTDIVTKTDEPEKSQTTPPVEKCQSDLGHSFSMSIRLEN